MMHHTTYRDNGAVNVVSRRLKVPKLLIVRVLRGAYRLKINDKPVRDKP